MNRPLTALVTNDDGIDSPGPPRPGSDAALLADGHATLTALRSVAEDTALPLDDLVSRIRPSRQLGGQGTALRALRGVSGVAGRLWPVLLPRL
jgi:hypothetical protein